MKLVSYWRTAHKRHSVWALIAGVLVPFAGGIWASLPGALIDRLPLWLILAVPCVISALGLIGAYRKQRGLSDG